MEKRVYFVSDVHLGLNAFDPAGREARFVAFLRSIRGEQTSALYLLGDIFDFWYEYKFVVPKGYVRVFAALLDLMDDGVDVYFCPGNHDIWAYRYFEELGMKKISQPHYVTIGGKNFCLGHGDGLGMSPLSGYRLMNAAFKSRFLQRCFDLLHPRMAMALGLGWSKGNRLARGEEYVFKGESEPLYKWAHAASASRAVDYFIFGHLHCKVDVALPSGARLIVMKDWMQESPYMYFDGMTVRSGYLPNTEM